MTGSRTAIPETVIIAVCVLLLVVIILGNLVVILIFLYRPRMRTVTNYYIVSLSVADLLIGLFVVTSTLLEKLSPTTNKILCVVLPYMQLVCISASVWSLLAITVIYRRRRNSNRRFIVVCLRESGTTRHRRLAEECNSFQK